MFQGAIHLTLEMVLEEELKAMVGARRLERIWSRKGHRNGTFMRRLLTSMGQIEMAVPRSREHGSPTEVVGRYRRRTENLDDMIVEAYVSGGSQRKMGEEGRERERDPVGCNSPNRGGACARTHR